MNVRDRLLDLAGDWVGTNRLWLTPDDPVRVSETRASIVRAAGRGFALIRYGWEESGQSQDGVLTIRTSPEPDALDMVWIDSFHTGGRFMAFKREADGGRSISALGSWPAPPGPDWGWRIVVNAVSAGEFAILMYVITPDGAEGLAVEAKYSRVGAAPPVGAGTVG